MTEVVCKRDVATITPMDISSIIKQGGSEVNLSELELLLSRWITLLHNHLPTTNLTWCFCQAFLLQIMREMCLSIAKIRVVGLRILMRNRPRKIKQIQLQVRASQFRRWLIVWKQRLRARLTTWHPSAISEFRKKVKKVITLSTSKK